MSKENRYAFFDGERHMLDEVTNDWVPVRELEAMFGDEGEAGSQGGWGQAGHRASVNSFSSTMTPTNDNFPATRMAPQYDKHGRLRGYKYSDEKIREHVPPSEIALPSQTVPGGYVEHGRPLSPQYQRSVAGSIYSVRSPYPASEASWEDWLDRSPTEASPSTPRPPGTPFSNDRPESDASWEKWLAKTPTDASPSTPRPCGTPSVFQSPPEQQERSDYRHKKGHTWYNNEFAHAMDRRESYKLKYPRVPGAETESKDHVSIHNFGMYDFFREGEDPAPPPTPSTPAFPGGQRGTEDSSSVADEQNSPLSLARHTQPLDSPGDYSMYTSAQEGQYTPGPGAADAVSTAPRRGQTLSRTLAVRGEGRRPSRPSKPKHEDAPASSRRVAAYDRGAHRDIQNTLPPDSSRLVVSNVSNSGYSYRSALPPILDTDPTDETNTQNVLSADFSRLGISSSSNTGYSQRAAPPPIRDTAPTYDTNTRNMSKPQRSNSQKVFDDYEMPPKKVEKFRNWLPRHFPRSRFTYVWPAGETDEWHCQWEVKGSTGTFINEGLSAGEDPTEAEFGLPPPGRIAAWETKPSEIEGQKARLQKLFEIEDEVYEKEERLFMNQVALTRHGRSQSRTHFKPSKDPSVYDVIESSSDNIGGSGRRDRAYEQPTSNRSQRRADKGKGKASGSNLFDRMNPFS